MMRVLFVCVGNSGRSQMAEAIFNSAAPENSAATSAGTNPAERVSRMAVRVMREACIDISSAQPKPITQEMVEGADRIVTMGCLEEKACPAFLLEDRAKLEDWDIPDPKGQPAGEVRRIRDEIRGRVMELLKESR